MLPTLAASFAGPLGTGGTTATAPQTTGAVTFTRGVPAWALVVVAALAALAFIAWTRRG